MLGTPPYCSPEQIAGREIDHRSDIFSLGAMLYEMSSGQKPFQGKSSAELATAILRDTPKPLGELRPGVPEGLPNSPALPGEERRGPFPVGSGRAQCAAPGWPAGSTRGRERPAPRRDSGLRYCRLNVRERIAEISALLRRG